MINNTYVSEIMTPNPLYVSREHSVADVARLFDQNNIHHIPVVDNGDLVGMISKSDIDRISYISDYESDPTLTTIYDTLSINQVMSGKIETIDINDKVKHAAELLAKGRYHALPVMKGSELKGIVTSTDVIEFLIRHF